MRNTSLQTISFLESLYNSFSTPKSFVGLWHINQRQRMFLDWSDLSCQFITLPSASLRDVMNSGGFSLLPLSPELLVRFWQLRSQTLLEAGESLPSIEKFCTLKFNCIIKLNLVLEICKDENSPEELREPFHNNLKSFLRVFRDC